MRVLVTGASGFVGRHLVRALTDRGDEVAEWGGHDVHADGCTVVDLTDPEAVAAALREVRAIDAVVHLAGLASVGRSFAEPQRYVAENPGMTVNLFEGLRERELAPRVLVVSTGGVYASGPEGDPVTEDAPVAAVNPYVVSKLAQELVAEYYGRRGLPVVVARPFNHAGPGQAPGYLIADLASQIAEAEATGGGEVLVGDLRPSRDYTDVRDVVAAYLALLDRGEPGATYNVCSGRAWSGQEIADRLVALAEAPISLVVDEARLRPVEVMRIVGSSDRLRADTGWAPVIPLSDTLRDVLEAARNAR